MTQKQLIEWTVIIATLIGIGITAPYFPDKAPALVNQELTPVEQINRRWPEELKP